MSWAGYHHSPSPAASHPRRPLSSRSGQVEMPPLSAWPPGVCVAPVLPQLLGASAEEMLRCPERVFCNWHPGVQGALRLQGGEQGAPAGAHPWAPSSSGSRGVGPPTQGSGKMSSRGTFCPLDDFDLESEFSGLIVLGFCGAGEVRAQPGGASGPRDWGGNLCWQGWRKEGGVPGLYHRGA